AAVRVEDVTSVEIRRAGSEKEQRACEIFRLAETADRHAREKSLANLFGALSVLEHPLRERRTKDGRTERIDRDAGCAQFATERLGDAVDRRLGGAIGNIAGGVSEQSARR